MVYGTAGAQNLRLEGWNAVPIKPEEIRKAGPLRLADGRTVNYDGSTVAVIDPKEQRCLRNPRKKRPSSSAGSR